MIIKEKDRTEEKEAEDIEAEIENQENPETVQIVPLDQALPKKVLFLLRRASPSQKKQIKQL